MAPLSGPRIAPPSAPPAAPPPKESPVDFIYRAAVRQKLSYQSWAHHPDQAITVIKKLQRDPNIPTSHQDFYTQLIIDYNKLASSPDQQKALILAKVVEPLRIIERVQEESKKERDALGKSTVVESVSNSMESIYEGFDNLSGKGKFLAIGLGILTFTVLKQAYGTWPVRAGAGALILATTWGTLDHILKTGSGGEKHLYFEQAWNGVKDLLDGEESDTEDKVSNFSEGFKQTGLDSRFTEELAALADVPVGRLAQKYQEVHQRQSGSGIGEFTRRDLAALGLRFSSEQLNFIDGKDIYQMLDYIFGGGLEKDQGRPNGELLKTYLNQDISLGNFILNRARLGFPNQQPGLLQQGVNTVDAALDPIKQYVFAGYIPDNYQLRSLDKREITTAQAGITALVPKLTALNKASNEQIQDYAGLDKDEVDALFAALNDIAGWESAIKTGLLDQTPNTPATRKRTLLNYQAIAKLVDAAHAPVALGLRVEQETHHRDFITNLRADLEPLDRQLWLTPEGQNLIRYALVRYLSIPHAISKVLPSGSFLPRKMNIEHLEQLLASATSEPENRREAVLDYIAFENAFNREVKNIFDQKISPQIDTLEANVLSRKTNLQALTLTGTLDQSRQKVLTITSGWAAKIKANLQVPERSKKVKALTSYFEIWQAYDEVKSAAGLPNLT